MDFLTIFVQPPGDLLYFLTVAALSLACAAMALGQRIRHPDDMTARRYSFATIAIVATWILLLAGALASLLFSLESRLVLPPLESAANVLAILLSAWLFLSADHGRWGKFPAVLLALLLAFTNIGYVVTASQWARSADAAGFHSTTWALPWIAAPLIILILSGLVALVFFRMVIDAPLKIVFFAVLALGYGGALAQMLNGSATSEYIGLIRLSFVAGMAIALVLVYRAMTTRLEINIQLSITQQLQAYPAYEQQPVSTTGEAIVSSTPPIQEKPTSHPIQRESVQLLRVLGLMMEDSTPENIPWQVVKVSLDVLRAEVGALLLLQDANYADISAIYDRSLRRTNSGVSLNLDNQPTLVNALERRTQRPILPDRNPEELSDLYTRIGVSQIGPVYFQPLIHDSEVIAVLMIALPYTQRELTSSEEEILKGIAIISAGLLSLSYKSQEASQLAEERAIQAMVQGVSPSQLTDKSVLVAREEMQASLQLARDQVTELSKQVMQLKLQLEKERSRIAAALGDTQEGLSISQKIVAISDEQQKLRDERDQLAARLQEAQTTFTSATASNDTEVVNDMIATLQRERDALQVEKEHLQVELEDLRQNDGMIVPEAFQDVIERMSEDKARLQHERDQLSSRLDDLQIQLGQLGIEGGASGLAYLVGKLYEDRAMLRTKNETLTAERNILLQEREQLETSITQEKERQKLITTLQEQIKHLAADREAATKQRDQLRTENMELAAKLDSVKEHRARIMAQVVGYEEELKENHDAQARLHRQIQRLSDTVSQIMSERDKLNAELQAAQTERNQLLARAEGDRGRIQQVGEEGVGALKTMVADLSDQRNVLDQEVNQLRAAVAQLQNQLEAAEIHASGTLPTATTNNGYAGENADLVMGLVQELRTPMTSITGYVDLLLAESAGILGEMQRQFLQRVASNVNRLASMLDDLIHITALDAGRFSLSPEPIDVLTVIEDSITNAAMQFREKGLMVNLELEEGLPALYADHDSFNQIIGQLLTNAYLASPPDTEITISAGLRTVKLAQADKSAQPVDCLFVSVADRGGGISPEDQARVFVRKYKAENPLIQGLGDTGVGMAIAKALVEAHGGSLWLESQLNVGSVFNFVLPFRA